jgi:hypothetical protein
MRTALILIIPAIVFMAAVPDISSAGQVWAKCHISCRCLCDDSIGNFMFAVPIDKSPDIGFEADLTCKAYAARACSDGCNGLQYSFTYQVVSP